MYHDVVPDGSPDLSGFPGVDAARYKVTPARFAAHLDALLRTGHVAQDDVHATLVTFDDGGASALRAADLLEERGLRGWFFVTTDYIGHRGFLDARDLRELHARGHIVGSHSCSHPLRMAHCSDRQLNDEWIRSRSALAAILGHDVPTASVPGGDYSPRVAIAAGAAGFTLLFTSEPTRAIEQVGPVTVRGRFVVRHATTPRTVSALARGGRWPAAVQLAGWNVRKGMKRVAGTTYLRLRRRLLRHGDDVAWGDAPAGGERPS
jgi:peptidoglycan/xylan/chitin deacetylase (PgdA/CDA1 family)